MLDVNKLRSNQTHSIGLDGASLTFTTTSAYGGPFIVSLVTDTDVGSRVRGLRLIAHFLSTEVRDKDCFTSLFASAQIIAKNEKLLARYEDVYRVTEYAHNKYNDYRKFVARNPGVIADVS